LKRISSKADNGTGKVGNESEVFEEIRAWVDYMVELSKLRHPNNLAE